MHLSKECGIASDYFCEVLHILRKEHYGYTLSENIEIDNNFTILTYFDFVLLIEKELAILCQFLLVLGLCLSALHYLIRQDVLHNVNCFTYVVLRSE